MKMMINCIHCGEPIPEKRAELGYDTCLKCSTEERYVGRRQDKHGDIDIMRSNQDYFKKSLKRENRAGFSANLPFGSPKNPRA
jgi:hypothetical protein